MNEPTIRRSLDPVPTAAAEARASMEALRSRLSEDAFSDLQLMVSELVTNSLRHSDLKPTDRITLTAHPDGVMLRVEVRNPGKGFPIPARESPAGVGGWGLVIVAELATKWGVFEDGSTCVWFEMPLDAARSEGR